MGAASGRLCPMPADFTAVFDTLKPILGNYSGRLTVKADTAVEYTLVSNTPSPFPQHKGQPMYFGSVRLGKAYVSFHLMPLYMSPALTGGVPPALKERMQGKTCFNFKREPEPELIADLARVTEAGFNDWSKKNWV